MTQDRGSITNPGVAIRDLIREQARVAAKDFDQVVLGTVADPGDGVTVAVNLDGFSGGSIDATWCAGGVAAADDRVVVVTTKGGQTFFVLGVAGSGGHDHDSDYVNVTGDTMTGSLFVQDELIGFGTVGGAQSYTPHSEWESLQLNYAQIIHRDATAPGLHIHSGARYSAAGYTYDNPGSDEAVQVSIANGVFAVKQAPTGADGAALTFTERFRIENMGDLLFMDAAGAETARWDEVQSRWEFDKEAMFSGIAGATLARFRITNDAGDADAIVIENDFDRDIGISWVIAGSERWSQFVDANTLGADPMIFAGGTTELQLGRDGKVEVHATSAIGELRVTSASAGYADVRVLSQSGNGWVGTLTNHEMRIGTNNSAKVYIDTTGRVGIGSSPGTFLDVDGDGRIDLGGAGTVLTLVADTDALTFYGSSGDWWIRNAGQNNGFVIYDGTGGVEILYNNAVDAEFDSTGITFHRAIQVSGSFLTLNDPAAGGNPMFQFQQAGVRRSFIQHVDSGDQLRIVSEYGDIRLRTGTGGVEADALLLDQAQRAYFYANVNLGANDLNNVGNIFASYMELSTNLYFTGTGDVGITYTSADGSRYGLLFEGSGTTDKVVLANRHANGIVEIRANSATAGGAGETTVAGFYDTALEVFKQLRMNGNPLYLEGGDLYTGGGRIHGSSNAIEIDPGGSNLVYLEPTDSKGAGYTGTGLIVRTWSNPNTNHPIFQVRSSGEAERFSVHHGAEHAEVASDGVRVAGSTYGADATIADDIFMTTAMETFTTGGYATLRRRDSDGKVMELVSSGDYKRDNVVVEPNFGDRIMQTRVKRGRAIEGRGDPDDWSVWLLAEELAGVYPEFVRWDPDNPNRALSIHYEYLTLPLIVKTQAHEQALWEYGAEIGSQRTALGVQESEIRALRDRVGVLESQVAALAAG